jgi:hypothetical protein
LRCLLASFGADLGVGDGDPDGHVEVEAAAGVRGDDGGGGDLGSVAGGDGGGVGGRERRVFGRLAPPGR